MLKRVDGKQVIALSQWQDLASYEKYAASLNTAATQQAEANSEYGSAPAPARSLVFELATVQTAIAGAKPALRGKEAMVEFSEFVPTRVEQLPRVVSEVESLLPTLLQQQPVPQSVVVLKASEAGEVALLNNWNCSALFEDVGKPVPLTPSAELAAIATHTQGFYDVVTIIPAEPIKPKPDKAEGFAAREPFGV